MKSTFDNSLAYLSIAINYFFKYFNLIKGFSFFFLYLLVWQFRLHIHLPGNVKRNFGFIYCKFWKEKKAFVNYVPLPPNLKAKWFQALSCSFRRFLLLVLTRLVQRQTILGFGMPYC